MGRIFGNGASHNVRDDTETLVAAAGRWAYEIQYALSAINQNTNQLFFWTMFLAVVVVCLFMLSSMNSLWRQLVELNQHQETYRKMWEREQKEARNRGTLYEGQMEYLVQQLLVESRMANAKAKATASAAAAHGEAYGGGEGWQQQQGNVYHTPPGSGGEDGSLGSQGIPAWDPERAWAAIRRGQAANLAREQELRAQRFVGVEYEDPDIF